MTSPPPDAYPLALQHGAVVSDAIGIVLDVLPAGTSAFDDVSVEHGAMVLGLNSSEGPTSLLDLRIGQVRQKCQVARPHMPTSWDSPGLLVFFVMLINKYVSFIHPTLTRPFDGHSSAHSVCWLVPAASSGG